MIATCRLCGSSKLESCLDLGSMPLVNSLLTRDSLDTPELKYPLELLICLDCSLVQLSETVDSQVLFEDYLYFSSFSDAMVNEARALCGRMQAERNLSSNSLIIEIASNDGYLLQWYQKAGIPVLGIEPAKNIAELARTVKGISTISEFFGIQLADRLSRDGIKADVIHANNVMAHVPDINGFVGGIKRILSLDGVVIVEVPYVIDMVDKCEFDTIYHEHIFYFSVKALEKVFRKHSLYIQQIERLQIHGGSLRLFVGHMPTGVDSWVQMESDLGVHTAEYYRRLAGGIENLTKGLLEKLCKIKASGKSIAAYGASAKGCILLNRLGINGELIDFVVDRSTYKQGKWIPGVKLPILTPKALIDKKPDYVLLLAWNFADEIIKQQQTYIEAGGQFIHPLEHAYEV